MLVASTYVIIVVTVCACCMLCYNGHGTLSISHPCASTALAASLVCAGKSLSQPEENQCLQSHQEAGQLHLCLCVHVYACVYMCMCMCLCVHVSTCVSCACVHVYLRTCVYVCMCVPVYIPCLCACVYMFAVCMRVSSDTIHTLCSVSCAVRVGLQQQF